MDACDACNWLVLLWLTGERLTLSLPPRAHNQLGSLRSPAMDSCGIVGVKCFRSELSRENAFLLCSSGPMVLFSFLRAMEYWKMTGWVWENERRTQRYFEGFLQCIRQLTWDLVAHLSSVSSTSFFASISCLEVASFWEQQLFSFRCSVLKISSSILLPQDENHHMDSWLSTCFPSINAALWRFIAEI